jgi:chemotaxis protein methyltransferase CheR
MSSEMTEIEYEKLRMKIEEKCGISMGPDKAYLLESRLGSLLAEYGLSSFGELYQMIAGSGDSDIIEKVIDAVVTNETYWFRDKAPWSVLEDILVPEYIQELADGKRSKVRIWSAACSSGQEPYSAAMCIDRRLARSGNSSVSLSQFDILATDISGTIVQMACMGRYDSISMSRGLDEEYRNLYFENCGRLWKISDRMREAVRFMQFNLQDDFARLGRFDVIFMRNVLIYFSDKLRQEIIRKAASVLEKNGVLFLGSSELFTENDGSFSQEQYGDSVYYILRG